MKKTAIAFDSKIRNKVLLLLFIMILVGMFFALDFQKYLTLEFIKGSREHFHELYAQRPVFVIACFVSFYIPAIALNLPGATLLGLMAGALFGWGGGAPLSGTGLGGGATTFCTTFSTTTVSVLATGWDRWERSMSKEDVR